jgi:hypothetical protein
MPDGSRVLVTPPAAEPVDVAELKDWVRVVTEADDELLAGCVIAARFHVEQITGRALITQTWDYFCDTFPYGGYYPLRFAFATPFFSTVPRLSPGFPSGELALPWAPAQSVTFVKYLDGTGATQTLDPTLYQFDGNRIPGRILPAYGQVWPVTRLQPNAVQVRYVAGFGANPTDVPEPLRQAIKVLVAAMYENREAVAAQALQSVDFAFHALIAQYRVFWL